MIIQLIELSLLYLSLRLAQRQTHKAHNDQENSKAECGWREEELLIMIRNVLSLEPKEAVRMVVLVAHEIIIVVPEHSFVSQLLYFIRNSNLLEKSTLG